MTVHHSVLTPCRLGGRLWAFNLFKLNSGFSTTQWLRQKFDYDLETNWQTSEWTTAASHRPNKAQMSVPRVKTILIVINSAKDTTNFHLWGRHWVVFLLINAKTQEKNEMGEASHWGIGNFITKMHPATPALKSMVNWRLNGSVTILNSLIAPIWQQKTISYS